MPFIFNPVPSPAALAFFRAKGWRIGFDHRDVWRAAASGGESESGQDDQRLIEALGGRRGLWRAARATGADARRRG